MAPIVESASTQKTDSTTSITFSKPASTAEGDLLWVDITRGTNGDTISAPAGWTEFDQRDIGIHHEAVFYKVAGASEPSDYTFSWGNSENVVGAIRRISGNNDTSPIDVSAVNWQDSSASTSTCPDVTTTVDDCLILRDTNATNNNKVTSAPTGTTKDYGRQNTSSAITVLGARETQSSAGSTGTAQWNLDNDGASLAYTAAIAPESTGPDAATISEGAFGDDLQQDIDVDSVDGTADHHDLERSPAGQDNWTVVLDDQTLSGGETLTDATVEPDTQYDYRLVSYELADESDGGTPSNTVTVETAPARPRLLRLGFNRCTEARMDEERAAADGVAKGFEKVDSTSEGADYSIDTAEGAQKIVMADQEGSAEAAVLYGAGSVNPGEAWTVEIDAKFPVLDTGVSGAVIFIWDNADGVLVESDVHEMTNAAWERKTLQSAAPDGAVALEIRPELFSDGDATLADGEAHFRDLQVVGPDQQTVDSFKVTGLDEADDVGKVNWFLRDVDEGEDFAPVAELVNATGDQNVEHEVKNLEPATYEITATASEGDRESGWAEPLTNVLGGQTITETLIDSLAFSENLNRDFEGDRSITDDLPSGENFGASLTVGREANRDNLAFAENFQENAVFGRQISDDLSLTEQLVIDRILTRLIEDSLGFAENLDRTITKSGAAITRAIQDTINFAENLLRDQELDRLMDDNLTFTENLNVLVNDSPISQAVERHWRFHRFQNLRRERRWSDESDMWGN